MIVNNNDGTQAIVREHMLDSPTALILNYREILGSFQFQMLLRYKPKLIGELSQKFLFHFIEHTMS